MAQASKPGSAIYQALRENFLQFRVYRAFVGEAFKMLKDKGMTGDQVPESLFKTYAEIWYVKVMEADFEQDKEMRIHLRTKTLLKSIFDRRNMKNGGSI